MPLSRGARIALFSTRRPITLASIFAGKQGFYLDPSTLAAQIQTSAGSTPATNGDPVGKSVDQSPNGNNFLQATAGDRLTLELRKGAYCLKSTSNDFLRAAFAISQPWTRISLVEMTDWNTIFHGNTVVSGVLKDANTTPRFKIYSGSNGPDTFARLQLDVMALVVEEHNGSSSKLGVNFDPLTTGSAGTTAPDGATILADTSGAGGAGRIYGVLEIAGLLTEPQKAFVRNLLLQKSNISVIIAADGDSLIDGGGHTYPLEYWRIASNGVFLTKLAWGGSRLETNAPSGTPPYLDGVGFPGDLTFRTDKSDAVVANKIAGTTYVYHCGIGTNDNIPPGAEQTTWIADYQTYLLARKAAGYDKVSVTTLLPRSDTNFEAFNTGRAALNPLIRSMASANGFGLVDLAAHPIMGVDGANDDTDIYGGSGNPHPSDVGQLHIEPIFRAVQKGLISGYTPTNVETMLAIAAFTTEPSTAVKQAIDAFITHAKANSYWTNLGGLLVFGLHEESAGRVNLVTPFVKATHAVNAVTKTGTLVFTPLIGLAGDGSSGFLTLGAQNALVGVARDSGHFGGWGLTIGNDNSLIGVSTGTSGDRRVLLNTGDSGVPGGNVRVNSTVSLTVADSITVGHLIGDRSGANTLTAYRSGTSAATSGANPSEALTSDLLTVFRNATATYSTKQAFCLHWGSSLGATKAAALSSGLSTLKTALAALA